MHPRELQNHFIQATIQIYNPNYFTLDHIHNRLQYKLKLNDFLQQSLHFFDQYYQQYNSNNESIMEEQSCVRDKESAHKIMIGRYTKQDYQELSSSPEGTQFVTIRNKSVSRKHGVISFPPIFKNNDKKSKTECFLPSYFYKIFKEEMPKEVLSIIRSFTFPTPVMLIKDLGSRIGTYNKLEEVILQPKYFQYRHQIFPRKFNDPFADTIQFATYNVLNFRQTDQKIAERGEQVIQLSEKSLKNQRPKYHLQDTDIYIELGSEANIRLSNIQTFSHQRKFMMKHYFEKIRKQVENKGRGTKFYKIQRCTSEDSSSDLYHTIRVDVLNWNQDFELEVKETYMLIAKTISEPIDFIIGRNYSCQIQIKKSDISGKHCKLTFVPDGLVNQKWKIRDLESTNGLWLRTKVIKVPLFDIVQTPNYHTQQQENMKKQVKTIFKVGVAQIQMALTRYSAPKIPQTLKMETNDELDRSFMLEDSDEDPGKDILKKVVAAQNDRNLGQKQSQLQAANLLDQIKSQSREEQQEHKQTICSNFLDFLNRQ